MSKHIPKREDLNSSNPVDREIKSNIAKEHGIKTGIAAEKSKNEAAVKAIQIEEAINSEEQKLLREKGQNEERQRRPQRQRPPIKKINLDEARNAVRKSRSTEKPLPKRSRDRGLER